LWDDYLEMIEGYDYGAVLRKPFDRVALLEVIRRLVQ